jgi:hypothetical protein
MNRSLHFRRRWAEPWLAPFVAISYGFLLAVALGALADTDRWGPGSGLRIWLAVLAPAGYWALAVIANIRHATVDASGVRIRLHPFPTGSGHTIPRSAIRHCYARNLVETTDSGVESANYYTAGVETLDGHQLDIRFRFETQDEALAYARDIARFLNQDPSQPPLEVALVEARRSYPTFKRQLLLWSLITLAALAAGIAWDR